jgi:tetratricopeptide (TPR) repeat protein
MSERLRRERLRAVVRMFVCHGILCCAMVGTAVAQSALGGKDVAVTMRGRVFDTGHHGLENAIVRLQPEGETEAVETKTDASGAFVFAGLQPGSYRLRAEKAGLNSDGEAIEVSASAISKEIELTLRGGVASQGMEFTDKPNFTVAGITDWTSVGGHGSDSILRTSETLARDTQGLKSERGEGVNSLPADQAVQLSSIRAEAAKGDLAEARLRVKVMIAQHPSAALYRVAGEVDEKLGDPLTAVHEFEQAVKLEPSEQNYFAWGSELLLHRAVWQAQEVFEHGLKAYPKSARIETALGTALFGEARYEEAATELCAASDLDPRSAEPYLFMGKIGMVTPVSAPCLEEKLARFVREQPENSQASYLYAMTILKRQEQVPDPVGLARVESLLVNAVKYDSKCADGYLQLGIMRFSRRSFDAAIDFYIKAIDANPQLADAHYRLGMAYDRTGKRDKAEAEFRVHDELVQKQSEAVEAQRREVKQFLVVLNGQPAPPSTH